MAERQAYQLVPEIEVALTLDQRLFQLVPEIETSPLVSLSDRQLFQLVPEIEVLPSPLFGVSQLMPEIEATPFAWYLDQVVLSFEARPYKWWLDQVVLSFEAHPHKWWLDQIIFNIEIQWPVWQLDQINANYEVIPHLMPPSNCYLTEDHANTRIILHWTDTNYGLYRYQIWKSTDSSPYVLIGTTNPGDTSFIDNDVEFSVDHVYIYRINAVDGLRVGTEYCSISTRKCEPETWEGHPIFGTQIVLKDRSGAIVVIFDNFVSYSYTRKLNDKGYFEIVHDADDPRLELYEVDGQVEFWRKWIGGDWYKDFEGFHRRGRWWLDQSNLQLFSSVGVGYNELLARRIIVPPEGESASVYIGWCTDVLRQMVRDHCGVNAAADRIMPGLVVEPDDIACKYLVFESYQRDLLLDKMQELTSFGMDFGITGTGPATFLFEARTPIWGLDRRSTNTDGNPPVIFSISRGNLADPDLIEDWLAEVTRVYVGGGGQAEDQLIVEVGSDVPNPDPSPWDRREAYISSQDIDSSLLTLRGRVHLAENGRKLSFSMNAIQVASTYYGRDWNLGDLITARYRDWEFDLKVVEITVSVSREQGEVITPTFEVVWAGLSPIYSTPFFYYL